MKNLSVICASAAMMCVIHVSSAANPSVVGTWQTEAGETGGRAHIRIEPCGDKMCGTIVVKTTNTWVNR